MGEGEEDDDYEEATQFEEWESGNDAFWGQPESSSGQAGQSEDGAQPSAQATSETAYVRGSRGSVTIREPAEEWPGDGQGFAESTYATTWYGADGGSSRLTRGS